MNAEWNFHHPVKVHSGNYLTVLNKLLKPKSEKILLVTSPGFTKRGLTAQVADFLNSESVIIFDQVQPNPDISDLDIAIDKLRPTKPASILAIGGGSVIDAAKSFAIAIAENLSLQSILIDREITRLLHKLQLIAVPTTSGTGSEVTPYATIWNHDKAAKYSLAGECVFADHAILDPSLTLSLPLPETIYTGLDAVSHALESIWNHAATPVSMMFAQNSLENFLIAFPIVLTEPGNLDARRQMQLASTMAGYAISSTKTAIAHSMSYPLTSRLKIPHGLACGFTLPALIELFRQNRTLDKKTAELLRQTQTLLENLQLSQEILKMASKDEIVGLCGEMSDPSRIENFAVKADEGIIKMILGKSLT